MHFFTLTSLILLVSTTYARYELVDDYSPNGFADKFYFFTDNDPTHGYVDYINQHTAEGLGLFKQENNKIHIGVDHTNIASGRGRRSVRITSKKSYTRGLFILDLEHMPKSECGSWPAFWTVGPHWPNNGEIDIIEGVNRQDANHMALHTSAGCSIRNTHDFTGKMGLPNCDVHAPGQPANSGCGIYTDDKRTYGNGFNNIGGGVYATEWTNDAIRIWFFPRSEIPRDITNGHPDPSHWGLPLAKFSGCNIDKHFRDHSIVFDTTFCGDWAGSVWQTDKVCLAKASSCVNYVKNNPAAFKDSYWLINSLKVYQSSGGSHDHSHPKPNSLINIKCSNGKFLSTENGHSPMTCNRDSGAQDWEQLKYFNINDKFAIQSKSGKFCSSENGKNPMICNRNTLMDWEKFKWISNADKTFSIQCNNGRYLSSEGGHGSMQCNRERIDDWEKFTWIQL